MKPNRASKIIRDVKNPQLEKLLEENQISVKGILYRHYRQLHKSWCQEECRAFKLKLNFHGCITYAELIKIISKM